MTQGLVLRLRLWDLLRWMLALNSTVLSDDQALKHFNAQERKRSTHRRLDWPKPVAHVSFRSLTEDAKRSLAYATQNCKNSNLTGETDRIRTLILTVTTAVRSHSTVVTS